MTRCCDRSTDADKYYKQNDKVKDKRVLINIINNTFARRACLTFKVTKMWGREISRKTRQDKVYCNNPFHFPLLKIGCCYYLYAFYTISFASTAYTNGSRLVTKECTPLKEAGRMNYYVPFQDDETLPFKKECTN